jgi:hypothetical protein
MPVYFPPNGPLPSQPATIQPIDRADVDKAVEALKEIATILMEQTKSYLNVVFTVGYAALFAIWGFEKDLMTPRTHAIVGLLALFSVAIFVAWEVTSALVSLWFLRLLRTNDQETTERLISRIERWKGRRKAWNLATMGIWTIAFGLASVAGLAAAAIIGWQIAGVLLGRL